MMAIKLILVYLFTVLDCWTGTLDGTTGLTYFWFLHILWLAKLILVGREPFIYYFGYPALIQYAVGNIATDT